MQQKLFSSVHLQNAAHLILAAVYHHHLHRGGAGLGPYSFHLAQEGHALHQPPKHHVLVVQVLRRLQGDEKLTPVLVLPRVGLCTKEVACVTSPSLITPILHNAFKHTYNACAHHGEHSRLGVLQVKVLV